MSLSFIVSEIGVNWDGDFDLLYDMVNSSKKAGCDAVKFQAYNVEIVKDHPERERLMRCAVSSKNIEEINNVADDVGIEWFATPMYPEAVDMLDPYVKRFKIREFDGNKVIDGIHSDILEKALDTKKEIIISSARSPRGSIYHENPDIKWLYCVPKYPCELSDVDFGCMADFDGYSNHAPNIVVPLAAAILGAQIIEVHTTLDKKKNFIDNSVSFDFSELEMLVSMIRDSENIKR